MLLAPPCAPTSNVDVHIAIRDFYVLPPSTSECLQLWLRGKRGQGKLRLSFSGSWGCAQWSLWPKPNRKMWMTPHDNFSWSLMMTVSHSWSDASLLICCPYSSQSVAGWGANHGYCGPTWPNGCITICLYQCCVGLQVGHLGCVMCCSIHKHKDKSDLMAKCDL